MPNGDAIRANKIESVKADEAHHSEILGTDFPNYVRVNSEAYEVFDFATAVAERDRIIAEASGC